MFPSEIRRAAGGAALALTLALTAGVLPATAQESGQESAQDGENPVVATVDGTEIRRAEVDAAIQQLPQQARQLPDEMLVPLVADRLAIGQLIADRAYAADLQEDPVVEERLAEAERNIVQDLWLEREIESRMTDEQIQAAYQAFLAENPPQEEVKARHILVETQEELFERVARNIALAEAVYEADLNQLVEPFAEAVRGAEEGDIVGPVQTQFGWHVILVEDQRMTEPPPIEEVRGQIEDQVRQTVVQGIVAELREDAEIVLYGPDGQPLPDQQTAPPQEQQQ